MEFSLQYTQLLLLCLHSWTRWKIHLQID